MMGKVSMHSNGMLFAGASSLALAICATSTPAFAQSTDAATSKKADRKGGQYNLDDMRIDAGIAQMKRYRCCQQTVAGSDNTDACHDRQDGSRALRFLPQPCDG